MAFSLCKWTASLSVLLPILSFEAEARGLLDGLVFTGTIGPEENPDLSDSLSFDDGYFWSDICTQCGFFPGKYNAEKTDEGVVFTGILESKSRGRFDYEGVVDNDGIISVSITWERRRWYWTSRREISFVGQISSHPPPASLPLIRKRMERSDPDSNPICARF